MPYTAEGPRRKWTSDELRERIPGWGADLDPRDRPSYPRERFDPGATGAHWDLPEPQEQRRPRERSLEHARLTPVFGTAHPLHGVSGAIRRLAYRRYSEGRAAHWILLLLGDRVEAAGAHARSLFTARPDNPITQTGALSERRRHGLSSRLRSPRADVRHQWLDPLLVAGPWVLAAWVAVRAVARVRGRS